MGWSYSRQVKTELSQYRLEAIPCLWAELWGLSGLAEEPSPVGSFWVATGSALIARRAYRVMKGLDLQPAIRVRRRARRVHFDLAGESIPPPDLSQSLLGCPEAFLRGAFLSRGYISDGEAGSHLELSTGIRTVANHYAEAFEWIGIRPKMAPRRGAYVVYIKDREQIVLFLAQIGAHQALLNLESVRVVRSVKNRVNRLVNSETANLRRTVESGTEQAALLAELQKSGRFAKIPESLLPLASLRIAHPDFSLRELGLSLKPPLTKSAVNHRMRKLLKWVEDQGIK